jgi:hypothetical protein
MTTYNYHYRLCELKEVLVFNNARYLLFVECTTPDQMLLILLLFWGCCISYCFR